MIRILVPAAAAAMMAFCTAALAHAVLDRSEAQAGQAYKPAVRIGHGCDGKSVRQVRMLLPEGFFGAKTMAKPGWTIEVINGKYANVYEMHGNKISEGAVEVRWSGGEFSDEQFDEFVVRGTLADFASDTILYFPTTQICDGAELAWSEIPAAGQNAHDLEHPAPELKVLAQTGTQHNEHAQAGHGAMTGEIAVEGAWTRAIPPNAQVAGGFVTLSNTGAADDRLIGGSSPYAERLEVHEMSMDGDVMKMRPLTEGLAVPAGGSVELKPGGYHIMLLGLKHPLKEGEAVDATLTFEKAGDLPVTFKVEVIGAKGTQHQHGASAN